DAGVVDFNSTGGLVEAELAREWFTQRWPLKLYGLQLNGETELSDSLKLDAGLAFQRAVESYPYDYGFGTDGFEPADPFRLTIQPEMVGIAPTVGGNAAYAPSNYRLFRLVQTMGRVDAEKEQIFFANLTKDF